MKVTKVGGGSMTTVLHGVRRILRIKEGDSIERVYEDGRILIRKAGGSRG